MEVLSVRMWLNPNHVQPESQLFFTTAGPLLMFGSVRVCANSDTLIRQCNIPLNWAGAREAVKKTTFPAIVSGEIHIAGPNAEFVLDARVINIDEES